MNAEPTPVQPAAASWLAQAAGSRPARRLVNAACRLDARRRARRLARLEPIAAQERTLRRLLARAKGTVFGRDHGFASIASLEGFRSSVPVRTYETLWEEYLKPRYPVFENLTWPGRIPYLALTSGTTLGATKYIPVSREMIGSNREAAQSMVAAHMAARPGSRLFEGRLFLLGGTTRMEQPSPGVRQGDLSGVAAVELKAPWRPYAFPPLDLALESDWDRKLERLATASLAEPITLVSGVPSWLLMLFRRVLEISGAATLDAVWPRLEVVAHGGVRFEPYEPILRALIGRSDVRFHETYACSEGFLAHEDPGTGLLRLLVDHGIFYEFIPLAEYDSNPGAASRRWLGDAETGVDYVIVVSTCAGMWAHVIGDVVRFEALDPPLIRFVGRTKYTLSAFGEHLTGDEIEAAMAAASSAEEARALEWHVGPTFRGSPGFHQYVIEFSEPPAELRRFRDRIDDDLRGRNADYQAHRAPGVGIPAPGVLVVRPGAFEAWMRRRGRLGGQNKTPRIDGSGTLTGDLVDFVRNAGLVDAEIEPGPRRDP